MARRAKRAALVLSALFLAGCFEGKADFTFNPDGSGKVVGEILFPTRPPWLPVRRTFGKSETPPPPPSPEDEMKECVTQIIKRSSGIDAWKDVSFERAADGRVRLKATLYFKDLAKVRFYPDDRSRLTFGPDGTNALLLILSRAKPAAEPPKPGPAPAPALAEPRGPRQEEERPMSPMRRTIARRLVEAQKTAALLTTFNEIDMSAVIALRAELQTAFQEKFGVKLGFMSFFVKAAVDALELVSQLNAQVRGDSIVYHNYCDVGIAIGTGAGLVVPVLRNAEIMSFAEIEAAIDDFAKRAQEKKLTLEELQGGTFTISNGGIFGSLLSTPIINPPQSGVLGMHVIQDRPVAREGQVVIRPMMYVALTYDHRLVDGREAAAFLRRVKEVVEQPPRILLEV